MRKNKRNILLCAVLTIAMIASFTGCGKDQKAGATGNKADAYGRILLSVNPEIEIEYDDKGIVLEIEGVNDEDVYKRQGYTEAAGE